LWRLLISDDVTTDPSVGIQDLKKRYQRLQESIESMEEPPPPLVESSLERLEGLIAKAEPFLETAQPPEQADPLGSR
jgi:hypothetical protein